MVGVTLGSAMHVARAIVVREPLPDGRYRGPSVIILLVLAVAAANAASVAVANDVLAVMQGGAPSHVDLFDPKPKLQAESGKPLPFEMPKLIRTKTGNLFGSPYKFKKHGQSGIDVSDLFPHTARCMDDIAVIRSCYGDKVVHSAAQYELFSGRTVPGFPSMGSWAVFGLGSESDSLPAYVVMPDPDGALEDHPHLSVTVVQEGLIRVMRA